MCGIFGYSGEGLKFSSLLEGLSRLEYRGYDSCGIASLNNQKLFLKKRSGKIQQLKKDLERQNNNITPLALLHTRWATHGKPNQVNAHPHISCGKEIIVAHNGIIENFLELKKSLIKKGHKFLSQTDSEVIVHLIEEFYRKSLIEAVAKTSQVLKGSFALGVICSNEPDKLVAVRSASPLIVGSGSRGNFLASDMPAMLGFAKKAAYLKEEQLAVITPKKIKVFNFKKRPAKISLAKIALKPEEAERKGFEHFMLKEIHEQPAILRKILSLYSKADKIHFPELEVNKQYLKKIKTIYITACGTA